MDVTTITMLAFFHKEICANVKTRTKDEPKSVKSFKIFEHLSEFRNVLLTIEPGSCVESVVAEMVHGAKHCSAQRTPCY